jgi:hypothetical protein
MQFIGPKTIKEIKTSEEKTPAGSEIVIVDYEDGTKETLTKMMYDEIVSDKSCDLTELRDKRVRPIVATLLLALREWGLKVSELGYMSALLTQSLEANQDEAQKELWLKWIPTLNSLDDVDMLSIDRILKSKKPLEPIESPYNESK